MFVQILSEGERDSVCNFRLRLWVVIYNGKMKATTGTKKPQNRELIDREMIIEMITVNGWCASGMGDGEVNVESTDEMGKEFSPNISKFFLKKRT